jgi:hypothetical protein
MTPRVIINWIVQPHIDVVRPTFQTWQDRRFKRGKRDVANVARRFKRGKRDVDVARPFQTWQVRRCKRGK